MNISQHHVSNICYTLSVYKSYNKNKKIPTRKWIEKGYKSKVDIYPFSISAHSLSLSCLLCECFPNKIHFFADFTQAYFLFLGKFSSQSTTLLVPLANFDTLKSYTLRWISSVHIGRSEMLVEAARKVSDRVLWCGLKKKIKVHFYYSTKCESVIKKKFSNEWNGCEKKIRSKVLSDKK